MSTETARAVAGRILESLPLDLRGKTVRLAVFDCEEDCLFFFPRRALGFQQKVNNFVSREIRKRGGKVERSAFTAAECDAGDADARRAWLTARTGLLS